jgi:hypothetical protein
MIRYFLMEHNTIECPVYQGWTRIKISLRQSIQNTQNPFEVNLRPDYKCGYHIPIRNLALVCDRLSHTYFIKLSQPHAGFRPQQ